MDSMDTLDTSRNQGQQKVDVTGMIETIKCQMPQTYKHIQAKAADIGNLAYELVRRGLRGEQNCFYAIEGGRVVGTPFSSGPISDEIAGLMCKFGVAFVCLFCAPSNVQPSAGAKDGKK
jgi:hypothetical protein